MKDVDGGDRAGRYLLLLVDHYIYTCVCVCVCEERKRTRLESVETALYCVVTTLVRTGEVG